MKVKLRDYHVIGAIGKRVLLIHKDLKKPFYIATEEDDTESNGWKIPTGMTFAVTVLIRSIDSKNFQASLPLLFSWFLGGLFISRMDLSKIPSYYFGSGRISF